MLIRRECDFLQLTMDPGGLMETRNTNTSQLGQVDHGPKLNYAVWILAAVSTLFLSLRVYCKLWRNRLLWWDDYVLIMSWVSLSAMVCEERH